jgi:glycerol-3-phosphate dehydrogenase subunit B
VTRVVVVGDGLAGMAATWAASRGADVVVIRGGAGASGLSLGAFDRAEWGAPPSGPLAAETEAFLKQLVGYTKGRNALLATRAGTLRYAAVAHDHLLDLATLPAGAKIAVPNVPSWTAGALSEQLHHEGAGLGLSFQAVEASLIRQRDERQVGDIELARRHEDPARLEHLARELRAIRELGFDAVLLPPWLGVGADLGERNLRLELSASVGIPCGEIFGSVPSAMPLRHQRAFAHLLDACGCRSVALRATQVEAQNEAFLVTLEDGATVAGDAVILAIGGLLGGGIRYQPGAFGEGRELPLAARADFALSLALSGVEVETAGPGTGPTSLFGAAPEALFAGPSAVADRVGLVCDANGGARGPYARLYACGDLVARAPRSALHAIESGLRAGHAAIAG